jgi:hypothetical protein
MNPMQTIYDQTVIAAARSIFVGRGGKHVHWDELPPDQKEVYIEIARKQVRDDLANLGMV